MSICVFSEDRRKCIWIRISLASIFLKKTGRRLTTWGPIVPSPANIWGCVQYIRLVWDAKHLSWKWGKEWNKCCQDGQFPNNGRETGRNWGKWKSEMMDHTKDVDGNRMFYWERRGPDTFIRKYTFKGNWQTICLARVCTSSLEIPVHALYSQKEGHVKDSIPTKENQI